MESWYYDIVKNGSGSVFSGARQLNFATIARRGAARVVWALLLCTRACPQAAFFLEMGSVAANLETP